MNLKLRIQLAFTIIIVAVTAPQLCAQDYAVTWHTSDGGGGESTGGVYSISGTIGQPDASPTMTNGQYALTGGFWALPAPVENSNPPVLTIRPAGPGFLQIAWDPAAGTNWILQQTGTLFPANWTNAPSGLTNPVIVSAEAAAKFYRLAKPSPH